MLDRILNPENVSYLGFTVFWIGALAAIGIGIGAGIASIYHAREKRDGKR